jgi:hypothetical protein
MLFPYNTLIGTIGNTKQATERRSSSPVPQPSTKRLASSKNEPPSQIAQVRRQKQGNFWQTSQAPVSRRPGRLRKSLKTQLVGIGGGAVLNDLELAGLASGTLRSFLLG